MNERKIDISVHPIKKLVIFECTEFTAKEFFEKMRFIAMSGEPIAVNQNSAGFIRCPEVPADQKTRFQHRKGNMPFHEFRLQPFNFCVTP